MRSYRQYCALARALDLVGERWTLLIIRELFAGDSRYSDLRDCLPGIASNLLADRLRQLQSDGIIEAYHAPRPVRATVYRLTARGRELGPVLRALVAWGGPLVADQQGEDTFRTHWLALGLPTLFDGVAVADLAPLSVHIQTGDQPATLHVAHDGLSMSTGTPTPPTGDDTLVVAGPPHGVFALLTGAVETPTDVEIRGPEQATERFQALAARCRLAP